MGFLDKLFGSYTDRELKKIYPIAKNVMALEDEYAALTDEQLRGKTELFRQRLQNGETLDDLARRFTVSKFYMCRSFKEHNGISIHGYLTRKRIMIAKSMIEGGTPAVVAAAEVGFGDYSAFFRAYRRIVGHSPRET